MDDILYLGAHWCRSWFVGPSVCLILGKYCANKSRWHICIFLYSHCYLLDDMAYAWFDMMAHCLADRASINVDSVTPGARASTTMILIRRSLSRIFQCSHMICLWYYIRAFWVKLSWFDLLDFSCRNFVYTVSDVPWDISSDGPFPGSVESIGGRSLALVDILQFY